MKIIINYIGKGTVGQVYLIKSNENKYVIKISNNDCIDDIMDEVTLYKNYFEKYNIVHKSYPIYYGLFKNINAAGIIYPYFGFYNLEKIKSITYKIEWEFNKQIIIQLINQLKALRNIIHCDLKPSNVVINVHTSSNNIIATIIDFGLVKMSKGDINIISTNYITSPESLLSLRDYNDCLELNDNIDLSKHDYFGLFSIIVNLFIDNTFWHLIYKYLTDIGIDRDFLYTQESSCIFVYTWYKFFNKNIQNIKLKSLINLINKIESLYPNIINKNFLTYNEFFNKYIQSHINLEIFDYKKLDDLENFTQSIIQFNSELRPNFDNLLSHNFIN